MLLFKSVEKNKGRAFIFYQLSYTRIKLILKPMVPGAGLEPARHY